MTQIKINQNPEWPYFQWTSASLLESLSHVRFQQGWLQAKQEELHPSEQKINPKQLFNTNQLSADQTQFINWWENTPTALDPVIRAGIAFLWIYLITEELTFATNAVELSLQKDNFFLFSKIKFHKKLLAQTKYLEESINKCHNSKSDITTWLEFFIKNLSENFIETKNILQKISWANLNPRQKYVVSLLINDQQSFLTNKKYLELTFTSRESAKRDLKELVELEIIHPNSQKGRGVKYILK